MTEDWDEQPIPLEPCAHTATRKTLRTIAGGGKAIYSQCLSCGSSVGNAISKLLLSDGEYASLPAFDLSFKEQAEKERSERIEAHRVQQLTDTGNEQIIYTEKYHDYLLSEIWRANRTAVLERDKYQCQGCRSSKATQVHHLTYDHVFNELLFELVSVCEPCHRKCHPEK